MSVAEVLSGTSGFPTDGAQQKMGANLFDEMYKYFYNFSV